MEAEALWKKKLEAEAKSEAFDFLRSQKQKYFIKHGSGMRKWLNFCGSKALWRKKLEAEANSEATNFTQSWKRKQKIMYCFHIPENMIPVFEVLYIIIQYT